MGGTTAAPRLGPGEHWGYLEHRGVPRGPTKASSSMSRSTCCAQRSSASSCSSRRGIVLLRGSHAKKAPKPSNPIVFACFCFFSAFCG